MPTIEIEALLSAAFRGGDLRARELRLTDDEADYIRAHTAAQVVPMGRSGGKGWYEITFRGAEN